MFIKNKIKFLIILIQLLLLNNSYGQDVDYAGTYTYGASPDKGRTGVIYVYPDSDSTLLFYLELNRGAPSYNSGAITGQMNIYSPGKANFTMIKETDFINCSMNFWFTNDSLFIRTNDKADECGYGYGIHSYGDFKRTNKEKPEFFIERNGEKTWFKSLDWRKMWN